MFSEVINESDEAYKEANQKSEEKLPSTHPIRLGLALNYSVFYYEIKQDSDKACAMAKKVSCTVKQYPGVSIKKIKWTAGLNIVTDGW